jgi:hypothetical protein
MQAESEGPLTEVVMGLFLKFAAVIRRRWRFDNFAQNIFLARVEAEASLRWLGDYHVQVNRLTSRRVHISVSEIQQFAILEGHARQNIIIPATFEHNNAILLVGNCLQ